MQQLPSNSKQLPSPASPFWYKATVVCGITCFLAALGSSLVPSGRTFLCPIQLASALVWIYGGIRSQMLTANEVIRRGTIMVTLALTTFQAIIGSFVLVCWTWICLTLVPIQLALKMLFLGAGWFWLAWASSLLSITDPLFGTLCNFLSLCACFPAAYVIVHMAKNRKLSQPARCAWIITSVFSLTLLAPLGMVVYAFRYLRWDEDPPALPSPGPNKRM